MRNQTKCCCLTIQRAFLYILFLDMSRIVWGLLICAFLFQKSSSFSLVITIADIICIVFQASIALYIQMRALPTNNKKPIYVYRKFKIIFVCFNTIDRLLVPIIDCTLIFQDDEDSKDLYCKLDNFVTLIITSIVWNFIETYFYTIVQQFVLLLQRAEYQYIRQSNGNKKIDNSNCAIIYEVNGIKPATRRGQLIVNIDKIELGQIKTNNEVQRFISQPLTQPQSFQVYGMSNNELVEINLIN